MSDVPWDDYYGPGSPLDRFVQHGGRVLRLGADIDTVTLLHWAESLAPIVGKRRVRRHRLVLGVDGRPEVRVVDTLDDSDGIADYPGVDEDEFGAILRSYLVQGAGCVVGSVVRTPSWSKAVIWSHSPSTGSSVSRAATCRRVALVQIDNGDVTLNVETAGDEAAPPLLLLHGITASLRSWEWFVPALADRFHVLSLDFRGHGKSGRPPTTSRSGT